MVAAYWALWVQLVALSQYLLIQEGSLNLSMVFFALRVILVYIYIYTYLIWAPRIQGFSCCFTIGGVGVGIWGFVLRL